MPIYIKFLIRFLSSFSFFNKKNPVGSGSLDPGYGSTTFTSMSTRSSGELEAKRRIVFYDVKRVKTLTTNDL